MLQHPTVLLIPIMASINVFYSCFSSCLSAFTKTATLKQLVTWHFWIPLISQIKNKDLCIEASGLFLGEALSSLQTERLPRASTHILVASHIPKKKNTCGTKDVPVTEITLLLSLVLYLLIGASALLFCALTEHSKPFHRMFVCPRHIFFCPHPPTSVYTSLKCQTSVILNPNSLIVITMEKRVFGSAKVPQLFCRQVGR